MKTNKVTVILLFTLLISCTPKQQQMESGIVVRAVDIAEQPADITQSDEVIENTDYESSKWTIRINFINKDYVFLVKDVISQTIEDQIIQESPHDISVNIPTAEEEVFVNELISRLNRYTKIERQEKLIVLNELKDDYLRMPRYHSYYNFIKILDKSFIDKVLSLSRRSKHYIVSEWEKEDGFYLAIWTSASSEDLVKVFRKEIPELTITNNNYTITLEKKATTLIIDSPDQNFQREIKMSLSTRFDDLAIPYKENDNSIKIWPNEGVLITEVIQKIFKEDEILPFVEIALDKESRTVIVKKK